jgi:hypothetical protein
MIEHLINHWVAYLTGSGGFALLLAFLFRESISAIIQAWWAKKIDDKKPQSSTNGYVRKSFCELQHRGLVEMVKESKEHSEKVLDAMNDLGQRQMQALLPIKEDIGKIKGKLGIE